MTNEQLVALVNALWLLIPMVLCVLVAVVILLVAWRTPPEKNTSTGKMEKDVFGHMLAAGTAVFCAATLWFIALPNVLVFLKSLGS